MTEPKPFFVVWQPGTGNPTVRHKTEEDALQEARRLAGMHPGKSFYVLRVVAEARKVDVDVRFFERDGIPF